jgi:hydroxymethylpyrimidine pyrophosphatase-like HAD family hydrolase
MVNVIITDIEGVLTSSEGSQSPWSLESLLKIRNFIHERKRNIVCILCSGRPTPYGEALIQALDLFFALPKEEAINALNMWKPELISWPSIFENGTCFYDPLAKRVINNPDMTKKQFENIRQIRERVVPDLIRKTGAQLEAGKIFCISVNPPFKNSHEKERISTDDFRPSVEDFLRAFKDDVDISNSISAIDITPKGITKASAVKFLLRNIFVSPEEVLGIGDSSADEDWLKIVGWSATPANGRNKLPSVHFCSPYETTEGFLDIIENLERHNYLGLGRR